MIINNLTQLEEEMDRLQLERAAALTAARYDHPPLAFVCLLYTSDAADE